MRVLVVDDSRTMRKILRTQLAAEGFDVVEAEHGQEALERLREPGASVGLALVDWNMPVMGGLDLLVEIRHDAKLSSLPVLMVTSECELDTVAKALEAGANEYLMKPFTPEGLHEKLDMMGMLS